MTSKPRKRKPGQPTVVEWHNGYLVYFRFAQNLGVEPPKTLRIVDCAHGCTISGRFAMENGLVATLTTRIAITPEGQIDGILSEQMKVHLKSSRAA
jgi:hypothetical protein